MKNKFSKLVLSASIMLAMAFTFNCSSGDGDDGNNNGGGTPSGGGGGAQGGCPDATTGSGTLTCGGQTYKTVVIGSQTWMAQNLNYTIGESKCYGDSEANCTTYGRLYDWTTARLACPSGWHLPSHAEWSVLTDLVGGSDVAGTKLKSTSFGGTDDKEFAAIGGGQGNPDGTFSDIDEDGNWWSATENSAADNSTAVTNDTKARVRSMGYNRERVSKGQADKTYLFSVRCVKN